MLSKQQVAEQLLKLASYSKDPRVKTLAVFSEPLSHVAAHISDMVDDCYNAGIKTISGAADAIFNTILNGGGRRN